MTSKFETSKTMMYYTLWLIPECQPVNTSQRNLGSPRHLDSPPLHSFLPPSCAFRCGQMTEADREAINSIYRQLGNLSRRTNTDSAASMLLLLKPWRSLVQSLSFPSVMWIFCNGWIVTKARWAKRETLDELKPVIIVHWYPRHVSISGNMVHLMLSMQESMLGTAHSGTKSVTWSKFNPMNRGVSFSFDRELAHERQFGDSN